MTADGHIRRALVSAVDIGTNTVKITHAAVQMNGEILVIRETANTIRLGKGIEETGLIDLARIQSCIDLLKVEAQVGHMLGSDAFIGVATEVLRVATNGAQLLHRILEETGWDINIITGEEEARLTFVGLKHEIPSGEDAMIVDIGGGSTEIILSQNDEMTASTSLALGSGRLADRFFANDPPGIEALMSASGAATGKIEDIGLLPESVDALLLAGGNGIFISRLIEQLFPGEPLSAATVERLLLHFATTRAKDAANRLGIVEERARVLPAGAAIAFAFLLRVEAKHVAGVPSGIRTGLIHEYVNR